MMVCVKGRALAFLAVLALLAGLCLVPALASTASPPETADGEADSILVSQLYLEVPEGGVPSVADESMAAAPALGQEAPAAAPAPSRGVVPPAEQPAAEEPPQEPPEEPAEEPVDEPEASAVDPTRPVPANFTATYQFNFGLWTRVVLAWDAVEDPDLTGYYLLRWTEADAAAILQICYDLADLNPAALPYVQDLEYQYGLLGQPGWTDAERQAVMEEAEGDIDALLAIMIDTPGGETLLNQMVALADIVFRTSTSYNDRSISYSQYYIYVVAAAFSDGNTSAPSGSQAVYTVYFDWDNPAQPTGFTATAYDPGVALEWSRNTEDDLAGYNVYVMDGATPLQLNSEPIEFGTEFFHDTGLAGATYRVEAVDLWGLTSTPAEAVSVLAPATVYDADDPAWQYTGLWAREDYTLDGGYVVQVARDAGARASVTFTGRRVKVYSAYYWSCGEVRFYVDGEDLGTRSLYNPSTQWHRQPMVITGLEPGQHTLIVEATGVVGPEGYSFVNFQSAEVR